MQLKNYDQNDLIELTLQNYKEILKEELIKRFLNMKKNAFQIVYS